MRMFEEGDNMVRLKYPAIYTDNLGCDKCVVYFNDKNLVLKVRGFSFFSEEYDFDFYCDDISEVKKYFYLKDNELINYCLDIRVKIPIIYNGKEHIEKAILRIERQKNSYTNKLIIDKKEDQYTATGFDFKNLMYNFKKSLPSGYDLNTRYILSS